MIMLAISTGIPGVIVLILAGGMLFGTVYGTILSSIGVTLGALTLFLASRHAFGDHKHGEVAPDWSDAFAADISRFPSATRFFCAWCRSFRSAA